LCVGDFDHWEQFSSFRAVGIGAIMMPAQGDLAQGNPELCSSAISIRRFPASAQDDLGDRELCPGQKPE
jgi:hypothetical protein